MRCVSDDRPLTAASHLKELLPENSHLVVVVLFNKQVDAKGTYVANNFVVTGWANYIWAQG